MCVRSGHGPGLLDGLNPVTALSMSAGALVTAAPSVNSNVHVTNNVNGKQLPYHFTSIYITQQRPFLLDLLVVKERMSSSGCL